MLIIAAIVTFVYRRRLKDQNSALYAVNASLESPKTCEMIANPMWSHHEQPRVTTPTPTKPTSPQIASENYACPVDTYETLDTNVGYQAEGNYSELQEHALYTDSISGLDDGCAEYETPSTDVMRLRGPTQPATYYSIPNGGARVYSNPLDTPNLDSEEYVAHGNQDGPNYSQVESSHARADTDAVHQVPTISLTSINDGYDIVISSS